jgi:hypothetical protein
MERPDGAVKSLMVLIDNGFQRSLQLLVRPLKLIILMRSAKGAGIHQFQGNLHRHAIVLRHEPPFRLDVM